MSFKKINRLLKKRAPKKSSPAAPACQEITKEIIFGAWNAAVREKMGQEIAFNQRPLALREKVLLVLVVGAVFAQEIQLSRRELINKTNRKIGREVLRNIRFRLG